MKKVKLGLVGVGVPAREKTWKAITHSEVPSIAWSRYFPSIIANPKAELVAICDLVEARIKEVQSRYKVEQCFRDYNEMLEKADIDAVIITTPHRFHASMAIAAANAGKHICVEKPLATNLEDAKKVVDVTRKNKVKLMVMPWIYNKFFLKTKEFIDTGAIGKVCSVRGKFSHMGPGHSDWFYKEDGGSIFDLGIYPVSTITGWIGPAKRVQAFATTAIKERYVRNEKIKVEVEDNAIICIDFGNGTLASIETNYCTVTGMETGSVYEIHGIKGSIFLDRWETILRVYLDENLYDDLKGWMMFQRKRDPLSDPIVEYFIDAILEDRDISSFGQHQTHVIEILEKCKLSSKVGRSLELTTTFTPQLPPDLSIYEK